MQSSKDSGASRVNQLNARKEQIEEELERQTLAIRQGVPARTLKKAITEAEAERKTIEGELKQLKPINIHERVKHLRNFVEQQIASLPSLLRVVRMLRSGNFRNTSANFGSLLLEMPNEGDLYWRWRMDDRGRRLVVLMVI